MHEIKLCAKTIDVNAFQMAPQLALGSKADNYQLMA
jgi:ABC-type metal ion transport system substrate-binding protein